jgi:hypothetical protein
MTAVKGEGRNRMKRLTAVATGLLAALVIAAPVSAAPITGITHLVGAPLAGTTLDVDVYIDSVYPVVPFEYAIQNECSLPDKGGRTIQRDDIVYWTDVDSDLPHAVMPVYLQSIPEGSKCKVFLMRGNVQVKGSVTSYTVEQAP